MLTSIRRNAIATVLSSLFVVGASGIAAAQSSPPTGTSGQEQSQEQFDRDKVTLKDRVQDAINAADANVDALKRLVDNAKGAEKQHDKDLQKRLSDLRDHLHKDLSKIDETGMKNWNSVRPYVVRDIDAMNNQLKQASAITNVPTTGAANTQPQGY